MAVCKVCNHDMMTARSCRGPLVKIEGKLYQRIRFGQPHDKAYEYENGNMRPNDTCGDCGCHINGLHHWGCDMETCPKCGKQLIGCDCEEVYLITNP